MKRVADASPIRWSDGATALSSTGSVLEQAGSANNAKFAISGTKLVVNGGIDFEATPTLTARVRITDTGGLTFERTPDATVVSTNVVPLSAATSCPTTCSCSERTTRTRGRRAAT